MVDFIFGGEGFGGEVQRGTTNTGEEGIEALALGNGKRCVIYRVLTTSAGVMAVAVAFGFVYHRGGTGLAARPSHLPALLGIGSSKCVVDGLGLTSILVTCQGGKEAMKVAWGPMSWNVVDRGAPGWMMRCGVLYPRFLSAFVQPAHGSRDGQHLTDTRTGLGLQFVGWIYPALRQLWMGGLPL